MSRSAHDQIKVTGGQNFDLRTREDLAMDMPKLQAGDFPSV